MTEEKKKLGRPRYENHNHRRFSLSISINMLDDDTLHSIAPNRSEAVRILLAAYRNGGVDLNKVGQ